MKFYRNIDYFLFFEDFPHMGVPGAIASNSDGTANIYINTLYNPAVQERTIKHELRHLAKNHFHTDWLTLAEKELDASDITDPSCLFASDFSFVEYTGSFPLHGRPETSRALPGGRFVIHRFPDMPEGALFGFYADESMQPLFEKGELLYCDAAPLCPGDIALFLYRGETLCRQYYQDKLGVTYLFSLDRTKEHEDLLLTAHSLPDLTILGRLITAKPCPYPGVYGTAFAENI